MLGIIRLSHQILSLTAFNETFRLLIPSSQNPNSEKNNVCEILKSYPKTPDK